MKLGSIIFSFLVLGIFLISCERPPELSSTPFIEYQNVEFKQVKNAQDSLIVTIRFEDGDGDLGLSNNDTGPPFNEFDFIPDDDGTFLTFREANGEPPFNSNDWLIETFILGDTTVVDTVRIKRNENFNNFFVDFLQKTGEGSYEKINLIKLLGTNFDGRFQPLNTKGGERPLEGTLRYTMRSFGFLINPIFRNETLKLEIQIQDRALNRSNVVETPDFILSELASD